MSPRQQEFENWFDIFMDEVKRLGYRGRVDRGSAEDDYDSGINP